jgi:hypothetical protein
MALQYVCDTCGGTAVGPPLDWTTIQASTGPQIEVYHVCGKHNLSQVLRGVPEPITDRMPAPKR